MNKKIISTAAAVTVAVSGMAMLQATAENKTVKVVVDGAEVRYKDQQPVIENDRTLIPVRGAFEAMGAKVEWDGDTRTVTIKDKTNTKHAVLTIDSDIMTTYTYKSLLDVEKAEIKLDVPAQIMNDRTMLPLRAVGEAMGAEVNWDGSTYTASIDSVKVKTEEEKAQMASVSLSQVPSETEDEVVVSVDFKGMDKYEGYFIGAVTAGLSYDKSVLELKSAELAKGDEKVENEMGVDNPDYYDGALIVGHITADSEGAAKSDGSILKIRFKLLKNVETEVALLTGYTPSNGYDVSIGLDSSEGKPVKEVEGTKLVIDTTPLKISGVMKPENAPAATETTEATEAPEETAAPEATEAPEETAAPEASAEPTATEAPSEK